MSTQKRTLHEELILQFYGGINETQHTIILKGTFVGVLLLIQAEVRLRQRIAKLPYGRVCLCLRVV